MTPLKKIVMKTRKELNMEQVIQHTETSRVIIQDSGDNRKFIFEDTTYPELKMVTELEQERHKMNPNDGRYQHLLDRVEFYSQNHHGVMPVAINLYKKRTKIPELLSYSKRSDIKIGLFNGVRHHLDYFKNSLFKEPPQWFINNKFMRCVNMAKDVGLRSGQVHSTGPFQWHSYNNRSPTLGLRTSVFMIKFIGVPIFVTYRDEIINYNHPSMKFAASFIFDRVLGYKMEETIMSKLQ